MREDIGQIELKTLNAWPALQQHLHGGWLLRQSRGYTKRANSVQPLWTAPDADLRELVGYCEDAYHRAGLPTIFKITPFCLSAGLDERLEAYGYRLADRSQVMTRSLAGLEETPPLLPDGDELRVEAHLTGDWLSAVSLLLGLKPEQAEIASDLLADSSLRRGFFTLSRQGAPIAAGLGVIDDGYVGLYDIVTAPAHRGRGIGERLVRHILAWAQSWGAHASYLQVVLSNAPALRLYDKLGYAGLYDYWYRVRLP